MSPELMNLAISLGVFALLALIWRKLFATPAFPGSAVAPAMAARGDAAKPRNVVEIRGATQFDELINSGPACFVDWTASWCGPCQFIAPTFERLASQNPTARFLKVDVDANRDLAQRYKIKSMPTFICIKKGVLVAQMTGADVDGLEALVRQWAK